MTLHKYNLNKLSISNISSTIPDTTTLYNVEGPIILLLKSVELVFTNQQMQHNTTQIHFTHFLHIVSKGLM